MVKAVQTCGLPVARIMFDGSSLSVVIGSEAVDNLPDAGGHNDNPDPLIREPKL